MAKRVLGRAALQRIRIARKQFAESCFEPGRVIRDDRGQGGPRCELLRDVLFELTMRRHPGWGEELIRQMVLDYPDFDDLARIIGGMERGFRGLS